VVLLLLRLLFKDRPDLKALLDPKEIRVTKVILVKWLTLLCLLI
jgi:hypothetical protein